MKRVLIIGSGDAGVILANHLDTREFDVTIVDKSELHYYQPWFLYVAFKGSRRKIWKPNADLLKPGITFVQDEIREVNLDQKKAYGTRRLIYEYDYVVIATGTSPDPDSIPGLRAIYDEYGDYHSSFKNSYKLWTHIKNFKGGTIAIGQASPTCKCPPSLLEGAFQLEEYLNKKGLKSRSKIKFFTPYPRPYPAEPMNRVVEPLVRERGIEVIPFFDVDNVDVGHKTINSLEGDSITYDLPIIVPPCKGTRMKIVPEDLQDEDRFIKVDNRRATIKGYSDAYAIGDCNTIPTSKTGVTAHLEAMAVAHQLNGEYGEFNGRINCPFDTAYGKATFVIADFENPTVPYPPTRLKHMMKMSMARIYWMTLKGRADIIFDKYFDWTNPAKLNKKYAPLYPEQQDT